MILTVPVDRVYFPTLGAGVCDFIEDHLIFGPGDLRGEPAVLDDEKRGLIYRMYEVYPLAHPLAGRRRFKRVGISLPKGLGKTELAAWIAACELHPAAPVRCIGFDKAGEPIGGAVTDPYIPLIAYTEEQSDELAYGALRTILDEGPLRNDFDIGLERILRKRGDGKAVSLSGSPNARDGARTTFLICDETHWFVSARLKQAHQTMSANLAKRKIADPWMLEITTAPEPGTGSVAEAAMDYAEAVRQGTVTDASFFFFHRQAGDEHDLTTRDGAMAAVVEAGGSASVWRDNEAIVNLWNDPTTDRSFWERVWCNRLVKSSSQAFDVEKWKALAAPRTIPDGELITIGFDGSVFDDATAIVPTHIASGYQWLAGLWEKPPNIEGWRVPAEEVDRTMRDLFARFTVWKLYADPPYWTTQISEWSGFFGESLVTSWWTNRRHQMTVALGGFDSAIKQGLISHDGNKRFINHIGNARRENLNGQRDEQGKPLWLIRKDRHDSPLKMDAAMAAVLSWQARTDAIAAGALNVPEYQLIVLGSR